MSSAPLTGVRARYPEVTTADRRARQDAISMVVAKLLVLVLVAGMTFLLSSLSGHSMMENARRSYVRASERAKVARAEVAVLRGRVDRLTSMKAVDQWATARGFLPPESLQGIEAVDIGGEKQE